MGGKPEYYGDDVVNTSSVDAERGYGEKDETYVDEATAVAGDSFTYGDSTYAKIQRFAGKLKIEQRGIERVPEDERTDTSLANVGTMVGIYTPYEVSALLPSLICVLAVACCEHGRLVLRHRCSCHSCL